MLCSESVAEQSVVEKVLQRKKAEGIEDHIKQPISALQFYLRKKWSLVGRVTCMTDNQWPVRAIQ